MGHTLWAWICKSSLARYSSTHIARNTSDLFQVTSSSGSQTYVSRLEVMSWFMFCLYALYNIHVGNVWRYLNTTFDFSQGIQDALQRVLSSLLQQSPHRRVALVTFSDEVEKEVFSILNVWCFICKFKDRGEKWFTSHNIITGGK